MPIITLEVLSDSSNPDHFVETVSENIIINEEYVTSEPEVVQDNSTGVHFLTESTNENQEVDNNNKEHDKETPRARNDLLEYMMRNDGSVVCKLCGEILQSRTHWYRHKYKLHVAHPLNPSPLFQCEQCLVYFKSRKGYIGHLASRHSETLSDSSPVLTNSQAEALAKERATQQPPHEVKEEPDPEMSIPKSSVLNYQTTIKPTAPTGQTKKSLRGGQKEQPTRSDWEDKRTREEKLVADIIDRVRRECEAQGSGGPARRGYSRRTTVMNT